MAAHLEGFGSIEGVASAKGEIWSSLSDSGTGVVNLDANFSDQYIKQLSEQKVRFFLFRKPILMPRYLLVMLHTIN